MIAALLLLASAPDTAREDVIPAFFTAGRLYEICSRPNDGKCSMYVAGVLDGVFHAQAGVKPSLCGGYEIDTREAAEVVVDFLRRRPELHDKAAAVTVDLALRERLACQKASMEGG